MMKSVLTIIITLNIAGVSFGQDATAIIDSVYQQLSTVRAYSADAVVDVDVDFIQMPPKEAKVTFEAPSTFNIEADGFVMLPKMGMRPAIQQLDLNSYQAILRGVDDIDGEQYVAINMLPKNRDDDIVMTTAWIDRSTYRVRRMETFTKQAGSYLVDLDYAEHILPSEMHITFEVQGMNVPLKYFGNDIEAENKALNPDEKAEGVVIVKLGNYVIEYF